jgi:hypothetical protein
MNRYRALFFNERRVSKTEVRDANPFIKDKKGVSDYMKRPCANCNERYYVLDMHKRRLDGSMIKNYDYLCIDCATSIGEPNISAELVRRLMYYYEMKIRRLERKVEVRTGTLQEMVKCIKSCKPCVNEDCTDIFIDKD